MGMVEVDSLAPTAIAQVQLAVPVQPDIVAVVMPMLSMVLMMGLASSMAGGLA